jgi:hypothetical protein
MCGILCIFSSQYTMNTPLLHYKDKLVTVVSQQYALFITELIHSLNNTLDFILKLGYIVNRCLLNGRSYILSLNNINNIHNNNINIYLPISKLQYIIAL